ncbi:MAG TPA: ParB/RepB/Spo0J family partition protein [Candidatus Faecalibacterium gallistercoris]|uniref:ParB/RepB/Spo0J family partition protein n=1 Tax=Candidatus Faecalibacterium gallistercoris TaxID=2838579 RepID=A0A9D2FE65_9FIRM|nr:ParB/RepB/Spo0J family partition protein [Candidatus Faecalibacterium gallistercoris]
MPRGRGGLGRGLESLFEDAAPSLETGDGVRTVPLREIEPNPGQPRKTFNQDSLAELAASIGEHGLLQPIAVRPQPMGGYRIVAGERRWRACRMAGLTEVPVVIRDVSDQEAMELALVENLQREDLDPVEEACGIRELMDRCGLTQEQAAQRLGKSRSALANSLRLLGLPPEALELLRSGALTAGHAKAILGLPTPELQVQAAKLIAGHSLNVRQAEALCRKLAKDAKQARQAPAPEPPPRPALPVEVEESLRQALGSEVSVAYKNGRGSLTVHFYSDDQLRAFANLLGHYDLEGTGPAPVDQALWEQT